LFQYHTARSISNYGRATAIKILPSLWGVNLGQGVQVLMQVSAGLQGTTKKPSISAGFFKYRRRGSKHRGFRRITRHILKAQGHRKGQLILIPIRRGN
jgi:hypothetical protein